MARSCTGQPSKLECLWSAIVTIFSWIYKRIKKKVAFRCISRYFEYPWYSWHHFDNQIHLHPFCFYNLFHSPTFDSLFKGMEHAPSPNLCRNKEMRVLGVFSTGLNPSYIQLGVRYWDSGQEDHRYPFAGEENPKVGVFYARSYTMSTEMTCWVCNLECGQLVERKWNSGD